MSLQNAIGKTDRILEAMDGLTPTPINRMVITGLKDIKNDLINEIPVSMEKSPETGDMFEVTAISNLYFGQGEFVELLVIHEDGVHCFKNNTEVGYLSMEEVKPVNN